MKAVLQRVKSASVSVDEKVVGKINYGLMILFGFADSDNETIISEMIDKIINLRIFRDNEDKMNLSLKDINGEILAISQFTLYADTTKGRRPSFNKAAKYEYAMKCYDFCCDELSKRGIVVSKGIFGADMLINQVNIGPVTIILDSEEV